MWGRRGYDVIGTLQINFMFAPTELGIQPPWQVLAFGLVFAFGAMAILSYRYSRNWRIARNSARRYTSAV